MTKKEYIIAVCDALPDWEMGKQIKSGVINGKYDDRTINMLVIILKKAVDHMVKYIKDNQLIEKINQQKEFESLMKESLFETSDIINSLIEQKLETMMIKRQESERKKYQVFVSSTYSDLVYERKEVSNTIMALGCIVAGMEHFPATDKEQFEYIKGIIDESDYYVLILGGRYGSLTQEGISFTEREFDYANEKGIPILAFLHKDIGSIPLKKSELDEEKRTKLIKFREKVTTDRLVKFWANTKELCLHISTSLSQEFKNSTAAGWTRITP